MFSRNFASFGPYVVLFAVMAVAISSAAPVRAAAAQFGPPPGAELSREKLSAIDDFLNGEIAAGKIPGAIVLIQRHGEPVYFKCCGKRDVEKGTPMTADTIFPLHSVTKTITSATVFVQAVVTIDGKTVANGKPGPMTKRLREIYVDFARATAQ